MRSDLVDKSEKLSRPVHLRASFSFFLTKLRQHHTRVIGEVLMAGSRSRDLEKVLDSGGVKIVRADSDTPAQESFDACVLLEILGQNSHPCAQLSLVHSLLNSGGMLVLTLPTLDSSRARKQERGWQELETARTVFFDTHNLSALLVRFGFKDISSWPEDDGIVLICRKADELPTQHLPRLSIILPIYNEIGTCKELINSVLAKLIEGVEREILIVESNSTDGSREIIKAYEGQPRGKGHAVRNGMAHATGDVLLIQDADLEYDIEDYDSLLEPLFSQRRLFVLGSRHKGNWKMREFEDRRWLSAAFNFGQIFFTWLINVTCNTVLKDPFTMYKVFHRECLYGLELESNRFDLDWEIVIKFIRKGFIPLEIPVNYVSRSFSEGKKIRPLRDPILWLWALVRFRYGPLYKPAMMMGRTR